MVVKPSKMLSLWPGNIVSTDSLRFTALPSNDGRRAIRDRFLSHLWEVGSGPMKSFNLPRCASISYFQVVTNLPIAFQYTQSIQSTKSTIYNIDEYLVDGLQSYKSSSHIFRKFCSHNCAPEANKLWQCRHRKPYN